MKLYQLAWVVLLTDGRVRTAAYCIVLCLAFISLAARAYFDGEPGLALFFACIAELLAIGAGLNLWFARDLLGNRREPQ